MDTTRPGARNSSEGYSADPEELRLLARRLFAEGERMMRLKPMHLMNDSVRGLPAVVRALSMSAAPLSPSELAGISKVSDARIANILKVLEERGIVERRPSRSDRRRVEVILTERGRAEERTRAAEGQRFMMEFLDELGVEDSRELVRILDRINLIMERRRAEGRRVHPGCGDDSKGGRA